MSTESHAEQVSRVEQMVDDAGETWDLSDNDQAALAAVLKDRAELLAALKNIVDDLEARWDMRDPRTNPGIRDNVASAKAAIAKAEGA